MDHTPISRRGLVAMGAALATGAFAAAALPRAAAARAPKLGTQAAQWYRFKLGDAECTVVSDGALPLGPPGDSFLGASKETIAKQLTTNFLPTDGVVLEQNCLVVNSGDHVILFDNGVGTAKDFGPTTGKLLANLRAAGIDPASVTALVMTHAHIDHCWGIMADDGSRNFPNAQLYMQQVELEYWTDEQRMNSSTGFIPNFIKGARRNLLPNRDRMVFIKDGQEFLPGIQAMFTPGHTVGHTCYMITSGGKSLLNVGDLTHHQILLMETPRYEFAFDTDPKQSAGSRVRTLDMLASTRTPMLAYHYPWPGVGHVAVQGDGFRFFPAPMNMAML